MPPGHFSTEMSVVPEARGSSTCTSSPLYSPKCLEDEFSEVRSLLETASHQEDVQAGGCASVTPRVLCELANEAEMIHHLSAPPR